MVATLVLEASGEIRVSSSLTRGTKVLQQYVCLSDVMVAMRDLKSLPDRGAGSSPASGTKFKCLVSSVVERFLYTERVGGSNPSQGTI